MVTVLVAAIVGGVTGAILIIIIVILVLILSVMAKQKRKTAREVTELQARVNELAQSPLQNSALMIMNDNDAYEHIPQSETDIDQSEYFTIDGGGTEAQCEYESV